MTGSTHRIRALAVAAIAIGLAATTASCGRAYGEVVKVMRIESTSFEHGGNVPRRHTCDGDDVSPPLRWTGEPASTQAYALIVDDPDAPRGTWVHWVVYDLPAEVHELDMGADVASIRGALEGRTDFGRTGYGGPCPPPGPAHRYFFKLYALDQPTGLPPGATKADVEQAIEGHVLARAELMGRYARAR